MFIVFKYENLRLLKAALHIKFAEKKPRHRERLGFHLFLDNLHLNSASVSITNTAIKGTLIHTCASSPWLGTG